ncbi:MAG: tellurite resistance TerB family protein [Vulcanococcus sp.]
MTSNTLDTPSAFAAIALGAVSWDGVLTPAGSRALRHALDYRQPFTSYGEERMVQLMDQLLRRLQQIGAQHLMVEAAAVLSAEQRNTAYAVAAEIMRSDGHLLEDEQNILNNLEGVLELNAEQTSRILSVMNILHADLMPSD